MMDACLLFPKTVFLASDKPDSWNLAEIFGIAIVLGLWNAASTITLFCLVQLTDVFYYCECGLEMNYLDKGAMNGLIYLQVSISSVATIFCTRAQGFSWRSRPGSYLLLAFCISQAAASVLGAFGLTGQFPLNGVAMFGGCGWGWAAVAWIWSFIFFLPLDILKFLFRAIVEGQFPTWKTIWNIQEPILEGDVTRDRVKSTTRGGMAYNKLESSEDMERSGRGSRIFRGTAKSETP